MTGMQQITAALISRKDKLNSLTAIFEAYWITVLAPSTSTLPLSEPL